MGIGELLMAGGAWLVLLGSSWKLSARLTRIEVELAQLRDYVLGSRCNPPR